MYRTKDQVALEIIAEGKRRGITERGIVIAIATGLVESNLVVYANEKVGDSYNWPHDAVGRDGFSVGVFQQQVVMGNGWWWGDARTCMDPTLSAGLFYDRLAKRDYNNGDPGAHAQAIQGSAFPDRYAQRMGAAQKIYDRLAGAPAVADPNRPDFNEWPMWSPNRSSRGGTKVDAIFIHTQEGGGGDAAAEGLAKFLQGNGVSYHYSIGQASDGGVTVVDVVDTDYASWSVLSANPRSINLCFAGSRAGWTREQWLKQGKAIDVAAYLIVQDCKKYGIPTKVIAPPYTDRIPGISDHRYVTKVLGDGNHTDVGDQFPWDVLKAAIDKYASGKPPVTVPPTQPPAMTDRQLLEEILTQLRGPATPGGDRGWQQLGGRSLVDGLAELLKDKQ